MAPIVTLPCSDRVGSGSVTPSSRPAAASKNSCLAVAQLQEARSPMAVMSEMNPCVERTFRGPRGSVRAVAFSGNMKQVATASDDHIVTVWNFKPDMRALRFVGHTAPVLGVDFSPSGRLVASASKDGTVRFWQPKVKGASSLINAHTSASVFSVCFSTDDKFVLSTSNDKSIKKWEVCSHRFHSSFIGHQHWVRSAHFSKDGRLVVSGSDDKTVRLWDAQNSTNIHTFFEPTGPINTVRFYPDGTLIAGAGHDGSINIWDIRTNRLLQHYNAHNDPVNAIDFHPSGSYLVSASDDASIKFWDLREGHQLYTIHGHSSSIRTVAFSSDGHHFASSGDDKLVMIWKTNFDQVPAMQPVDPKLKSKAKPGETRPRTSSRITPQRSTVEPAQPVPLPSSPRVNEPTETASSGSSTELAATLSHIVNQLDIIRDTMTLFEQRLTMQESIISRLAAERGTVRPPTIS